MKTIGTDTNFLAIEPEFSTYDKSDIVIVSAPYEHTVSFGGGASLGPAAIIEASAYVEFFDEEFERELCFAKGIATLEPIDFKDKVDIDALNLIEEQVSEVLSDGKFVVTLGGEHTISTASIKAHFEKYPNMSLLQFDAHSDLRDEYEGNKYSHASIMARVAEFFPNNRITQVGIRAQCKEEWEFIKANSINTYYAYALNGGKYGSNWQKEVVNSLGKEIYITFDVDYFDPAVIPTTGTPEPNGMNYTETLELFREINRQNKTIIGFDVVELAPVAGVTHSNLTVARLVYKLLNHAFFNI